MIGTFFAIEMTGIYKLNVLYTKSNPVTLYNKVNWLTTLVNMYVTWHITLIICPQMRSSLILLKENLTTKVLNWSEVSVYVWLCDEGFPVTQLPVRNGHRRPIRQTWTAARRPDSSAWHNIDSVREQSILIKCVCEYIPIDFAGDIISLRKILNITYTDFNELFIWL